jgi:virginiamycin B lyase
VRYQFEQMDKVRHTLHRQRGLPVLLTLLCIIIADMTAPPVVIQAQMRIFNHGVSEATRKDVHIEGQTTHTKSHTMALRSETTHVTGQSMQSDPQTSHMHLHSKFVVPTSMIATFTEIRMPLGISLPIDITRGADNSYWVSDLQGNALDCVTNEGTIVSYALPTDNTEVEGITTGSDGEIWFAASNTIGHIRADGTITEFSLPRNNTSSLGLTSGPDGAVWFTEDTMNRIGRITTKGEVTEYGLPKSNSDPTDITQGPDGALWFVEPISDSIGRLSTSGILTEFPLPTKDANPFSITAGPNNALWFTERNTNTIGSLTPDGHFMEFVVPTATSVVGRIGKIGDGTLAFSEEKANQIGRINADGIITEFPLPMPDALPFSITNGGHGTVWFTETNIGQIGSITFPSVSTMQPDLSIQQQQTGTIPLQIGNHVEIAITIRNAASGAAITQKQAITFDEIIPAGLSDINVTGGPNWQINLTQSASPILIHGTYVGDAPVAPGATLAQITIGGTLSASAIPSLVTTGIVTIPNDSNLYNDIATDTITVATS